MVINILTGIKNFTFNNLWFSIALFLFLMWSITIFCLNERIIEIKKLKKRIFNLLKNPNEK
jgi:hypothetical protein